MNKIFSVAGRLYPILPQLLRFAGFSARQIGDAPCASKYCTTWSIVFLFGLLGAMAPARADVADTLESIKPGVVGVGSFHPTRSPRANLRGTGFVVGDGRYVISCAHIFTGLLDSEKNETWAVLTGRDRQMTVRNARVVLRDTVRDLILLRIEGEPLPALKLAQSDAVREGWQL